MNGPGDIPLTLSSTPDTRPCSLISIIPTLGMSSCRGRAEAFARRLSSKLRTLGSQTEDDAISPEGEPIINGGTGNTWLTSNHDAEQTVTDLQPLRHESDSFFDFDCELESPGSPVDECEYLRLIETASNTPHNSAESGYVCASAASSHSSNDAATFHDAINHMDATAISSSSNNANGSNNLSTSPMSGCDVVDFVGKLQMNEPTEKLTNGHSHHEERAKEHYASTSDELDQHTDDGHSTTAPLEAAAECSSPSANHHELCATEMLRMQADIINDLQKQSDEYRAETVTAAHDDVELSSASPPPTTSMREPTSEPAQSSAHTQHTTISVQTRDPLEPGDDEVLQVEVIAEQQLNHTDEMTATETAELNSSESSETLKTVTPTTTPTATPMPTPTTSPTKCTEERTASPIRTASPTSTTPTAAATIESNAKAEENASTTEQQTQQQQQQRNSALDTTDDEDECRPQRVRRCSSLKTGKTPPGTPGRKKIVRFADVLGLDLADVKTFLDEVPTIPKSAFEDLEMMDTEPPLQLGPKSDRLLMPLFQQPGGLATFLDIVREKQVSLENAAVTDHVNQTITGSVRVRNLDFNKSVHIRYSLDGWRSFADLQANYVQNSCDGFSDKFTFVLFGNTLHIGQRLEFAVRFQCKGQQFWDNNYGANYCFQCLPSSSSVTHALHPIVPSHHAGQGGMLSPTVGDAWCSSFY